MDTAYTSFLGDVNTLFTALRSVQAGARSHRYRLNEQAAAVSEMTRRAQDDEVQRELGEITRLLGDVRTLLLGRDAQELGRALLAIGEAGAVAGPEELDRVAGEVAVLLDQCLCASARIEGLLAQTAQRLSELEAAEV
jgi:hypothetical protein